MASMRWLLLSDDLNVIGKQCEEILHVAGQTTLWEYHPANVSLQSTKDRLHHHRPDRVIVLVNESSSSKLVQTINDHLLIPLNIAQATSNPHSLIPVLFLTCPTDEQNLGIIQDATDQLIHLYSHIVHARLFTPIADVDLKGEHFKALWKDKPDDPRRITILSDALPLLLAMIHDGKTKGTMDVCNRGTVSLRWIEQWSADRLEYPNLLPQSLETDTFDHCSQHMITPETRQLYQAPFLIPNVCKTLEQAFRQQSIAMDPNAPKTLLVTGGCGFIGSTFINHWLETYPMDRIVNIDRLDPVANTKNVLHPQSVNYSLVIADINNKDIILHLINQYSVTHILHFAVQAHLDNSFGNSITFTESNVYGTHSVLEASRIYGRIQRFIHISTDEVYGETPAGSCQEICLLNPLNPYAATIAAAEFLVKSYGESFKLPYCIIRLCNVYGPRQHMEKVIPTFIQSLLRGEPLKIHGDGTQARHYLYVDDVVRAIDLICCRGKPKTIYNIGTLNELTVVGIAQCLLSKLQPERVAEAENVLIHVNARSFTEKRYCAITSTLVESLGWKEQVTFDQGLDLTIQWLKSNPDYWNR